MLTACVFNPPVTGREVHDENGAYPADPDARTRTRTDRLNRNRRWKGSP